MIKVDELTALCGDDEAMVKMVLTLYLEEYGESHTIIQHRYQHDDIDGLFQIAHELKGMFSNLCAKDAMNLAQEVESTSKSGTPPLQSSIGNLCSEIQAINQQIQTILQ